MERSRDFARLMRDLEEAGKVRRVKGRKYVQVPKPRPACPARTARSRVPAAIRGREPQADSRVQGGPPGRDRSERQAPGHGRHPGCQGDRRRSRGSPARA